jgi:hypothetical protein
VTDLTLSLIEKFLLTRKPRITFRWKVISFLRRIARVLSIELNCQKKNVSKIKKKYFTRLKLFSDGKKEYESFSQSAQDIFVVSILSNQNISKTYLEIGSGWPQKNSNTFLLESLGWYGISIEMSSELVKIFNQSRKNKAICADALRVDYREVCKPYNLHFNYLSVDIDPASQSYFALKRIIESGVTFDTLTFEHDKYLTGFTVQIAQTLLLRKIGMVRLEKNVKAAGFGPFEDWWVHKKYSSVYSNSKSL